MCPLDQQQLKFEPVNLLRKCSRRAKGDISSQSQERGHTPSSVSKLTPVQVGFKWLRWDVLHRFSCIFKYTFLSSYINCLNIKSVKDIQTRKKKLCCVGVIFFKWQTQPPKCSFSYFLSHLQWNTSTVAWETELRKQFEHILKAAWKKKKSQAEFLFSYILYVYIIYTICIYYICIYYITIYNIYKLIYYNMLTLT